MQKETTQKIWLGVFVLTGLIFLSIMFYYLGNQQNIFDRTIRLYVVFNDVGGLRPGNTVRLSGINVGTVQEVAIFNDSLVAVTMGLEADVKPYIKKNATLSVGTDGLMGNRIIHIHPGKLNGPQSLMTIEPGDTLLEEPHVELGDMLPVLDKTNANLALMSDELVTILHRISAGEGSLGRLISDPTLVIGLEEAVRSLQVFSNQGHEVLTELKASTQKINDGDGIVDALLSDTTMVDNLSQSLVNLEKTTRDLALIGKELQEVLHQAQSPDGAVGTLLTNPDVAEDVEITLENIREGSEQFNEVMEGLKHNFLLRRYFRKKAKAAKNPID